MDRNDAHIFGKFGQDDDIALHKARDGVLFKVVGELSRISLEKQTMFSHSADLITQEGLAQARQEQGIVKGLEFAISIIMELGNDNTE